MQTRKLFVLLTRFPGLDAKFMMAWTRCPYTHVSLGLDENMNTYYSFVKTGFIVEDIARYNRPGREPFACELYALEVPQAVYDRVRELLTTFTNDRRSFHYARMALVLSLMLHIPSRFKNRYFCSQFVAHILKRSQAARLKKPCTLYFAKDFRRHQQLKMVYRGDLLRYVGKFGARPFPA